MPPERSSFAVVAGADSNRSDQPNGNAASCRAVSALGLPAGCDVARRLAAGVGLVVCGVGAPDAGVWWCGFARSGILWRVWGIRFRWRWRSRGGLRSLLFGRRRIGRGVMRCGVGWRGWRLRAVQRGILPRLMSGCGVGMTSMSRSFSLLSCSAVGGTSGLSAISWWTTQRQSCLTVRSPGKAPLPRLPTTAPKRLRGRPTATPQIRTQVLRTRALLGVR